jgi:hypothetical protein
MSQKSNRQRGNTTSRKPRADKGAARFNYIRHASRPDEDDGEIEHAPPRRQAPVSLPPLTCLQKKLIGGELI